MRLHKSDFGECKATQYGAIVIVRLIGDVNGLGDGGIIVPHCLGDGGVSRCVRHNAAPNYTPLEIAHRSHVQGGGGCRFIGGKVPGLTVIAAVLPTVGQPSTGGGYGKGGRAPGGIDTVLRLLGDGLPKIHPIVATEVVLCIS